MAEKREITPGWYIPTKEGHHARWVLAMYVNEGDGRERVIYSDGGVIHKHCLRSTFSVWIGHSKAEQRDHAQEIRPELQLSQAV